MSPLLRAVASDLKRDVRELLLAALGVTVGVAALTFFLALGRGVERAVLDELMERLPVNIIKVEPRTGVALGPLRLDGGGLLAPAVDQSAVEALRAVEGVDRVYPMLPAQFPMRAQGGKALLGRNIYTDMFAVGMSEEFVAADVKGEFRDPGPAQGEEPEVVPVLVSSQLLKIYNRTVAPAIGSPRLSARAGIGVAFDIFLGESYASGRSGSKRKIRAEVVGVSAKVPLAGITVPLQTVERWNREFAADKKVHFSAAYVVAHSAREIDAVVQKADALGLVVDDSARVVGALIRGVTAVLSLVAALILAVAALHTAQTFEARARARRKEIALLRALGATRGAIRSLIALEAFAVGLLGSLLGLCLGVGGALAAGSALHSLLQNAPVLPENLVAIDAVVILVPLMGAVLAALIGAAGPAQRAAKLDPAAVLSGDKS